MDVRKRALMILVEMNALEKVRQINKLHQQWHHRQIEIQPQSQLQAFLDLPGRPEKPILIDPKDLPKRHLSSLEGRAMLLHALTHIEFNAMNLALDAIWRFANLPEQYYQDWLQVAYEEAYHFSLLSDRLQTLGYTYGMFPAHNGLWEMCERTKTSCLARMALVPRTLEARGLDVSPAIRARLLQAGDQISANILQIILRDEIGHVRIGNHWFAYLCELNHLDLIKTYAQLKKQYKATSLKGPFNVEARRQAGFSENELSILQNMK